MAALKIEPDGTILELEMSEGTRKLLMENPAVGDTNPADFPLTM